MKIGREKISAHEQMPGECLHIGVIAKEHSGKPGAIKRELEGE